MMGSFNASEASGVIGVENQLDEEESRPSVRGNFYN